MRAYQIKTASKAAQGLVLLERTPPSAQDRFFPQMINFQQHHDCNEASGPKTSAKSFFRRLATDPLGGGLHPQPRNSAFIAFCCGPGLLKEWPFSSDKLTEQPSKILTLMAVAVECVIFELPTSHADRTNII
ncbi:hypothetical protein HPP92_013796 [Vanilla planifolia]|uniref:Uncharacterized protein n=1 Tax=Vanilla planifolia TaxID=51239 RepID=A0A835QVF1_VANPL|nr:hypothetical protein HPP92_013796 [Vanilla planifolia]